MSKLFGTPLCPGADEVEAHCAQCGKRSLLSGPVRKIRSGPEGRVSAWVCPHCGTVIGRMQSPPQPPDLVVDRPDPEVQA